MSKPAIANEVNLALKFSTALGRNDDDEALHLFKSASLDPTRCYDRDRKSVVRSTWNSG